jgi:hypothetical protein
MRLSRRFLAGSAGSVGVPGVLNLKQSNTARARAAFQAGGRNFRLALTGDSTWRGVDETAVPYNSQYPNSVAAQLAAKLNALGVNAGANNLFGICGSSYNDFMIRDSRCASTGATTAFGTAVPVWGGAEIEFPTAAGTFSFTPQGNVTKADIYYQDSTAGRTFSWAVDGGAATQISTTGANTIKKATVALGASGLHTLTLAWVAGFVRIYGVDAYDDTAGRSEISVWQWGISGGTSSDMVNDAGTPSSGRIRQMTLFPPDLLISECGLVNSWRNSRSVALATADMTQHVQSAKAAGVDFMFCTPPFDNLTGTGLTSTQDQYVAAMFAVAAANDVPCIDLRGRWKSYANSVANGWQVASDAVHPTRLGYVDEAAFLLAVVRFALGI